MHRLFTSAYYFRFKSQLCAPRNSNFTAMRGTRDLLFTFLSNMDGLNERCLCECRCCHCVSCIANYFSNEIIGGKKNPFLQEIKISVTSATKVVDDLS